MVNRINCDNITKQTTQVDSSQVTPIFGREKTELLLYIGQCLDARHANDRCAFFTSPSSHDLRSRDVPKLPSVARSSATRQFFRHASCNAVVSRCNSAT